jgi:hypothetical protein
MTTDILGKNQLSCLPGAPKHDFALYWDIFSGLSFQVGANDMEQVRGAAKKSYNVQFSLWGCIIHLKVLVVLN